MTTKPIAAHELRALWQRLPTTTVIVTPAEMRAMAERFQSYVRRRNRNEYIACAVVAASSLYVATWPVSWLWSVGWVLTSLGACYCAVALHHRGRAAAPPDVSTTALLDFHRAELVRQRDTLRHMWRLGLPMFPGVVLSLIAWWNFLSGRRSVTGLVTILVAIGLLTVIVVLWTTVVQLAGAARFQRMLEDLDRYREG